MWPGDSGGVHYRGTISQMHLEQQREGRQDTTTWDKLRRVIGGKEIRLLGAQQKQYGTLCSEI